MKRMFEIIGIITLLIGSFVYNEKVLTTSKLSDELLDEIKEKARIYNVKPIEAVIDNNTIIPGINGKKVNIKKSYENMKKIGYFNEKLLIYDDVLVKESLKNNKDKYIISANKNKKEISLMFNVSNDDDLNNIVYILDKKKIKGTFYINSYFLEDNHNYVIRLIQRGYNFGNLSKNGDYSNSDFVWMRTILTSSNNQSNNFCYVQKPNDKVLKICSIQNSYTIMPSLIIKDRLSINIKQNLDNGLLVFIDINKNTVNELEYIINYILNKGYKIKSLEQILDI